MLKSQVEEHGFAIDGLRLDFTNVKQEWVLKRNLLDFSRNVVRGVESCLFHDYATSDILPRADLRALCKLYMNSHEICETHIEDYRNRLLCSIDAFVRSDDQIFIMFKVLAPFSTDHSRLYQ